jgi:hypothetical protein
VNARLLGSLLAAARCCSPPAAGSRRASATAARRAGERTRRASRRRAEARRRLLQGRRPGRRHPDNLDDIPDAEPRSSRCTASPTGPTSFSARPTRRTPASSPTQRGIGQLVRQEIPRPEDVDRRALRHVRDDGGAPDAGDSVLRPRVTNVATARAVVVRVTDRGPFHADRIIDLSYAAARRGKLRADDESRGAATGHEGLQLPQLERLARPAALHHGARPGDAGRRADSRLSPRTTPSTTRSRNSATTTSRSRIATACCGSIRRSTV